MNKKRFFFRSSWSIACQQCPTFFCPVMTELITKAVINFIYMYETNQSVHKLHRKDAYSNTYDLISSNQNVHKSWYFHSKMVHSKSWKFVPIVKPCEEYNICDDFWCYQNQNQNQTHKHTHKETSVLRTIICLESERSKVQFLLVPWWSNHTSDTNIDTPVATLPGGWCCRVSDGTGQPGLSIPWLGEINILSSSISILWVGEIDILSNNFYLSVVACKLVWAALAPRYTSMFAGTLSNQQTTTTHYIAIQVTFTYWTGHHWCQLPQCVHQTTCEPQSCGFGSRFLSCRSRWWRWSPGFPQPPDSSPGSSCGPYAWLSASDTPVE